MEDTEVGKTVLSTTTILEAKGTQSEKHTEVANGERDSDANATINSSSRSSKKRKKKKNKPASVDLLNTPENMGDTEVANTVLGTTTILEAKSMQSEKHTEFGNGERGSGTTATFDANSIVSKKRKEKKKKPASVVHLNTPENTEETEVSKTALGTTTISEAKISESKMHTEDASGERGSGLIADFNANNTASKNRKRKSSKNQNPASDDLLNTPENMEVTEVANGTQSEKHMEISDDETGPSKFANGEKGSGATATNDVKTGSKKVANDSGPNATTTRAEREESMRIAKGGSGTTTTFNAKSTASRKKNKKITKPRRATLGEILSPRYLDTPENMEDTEVAKMVSCTATITEAKSMQTEKHSEISNDETRPSKSTTRDAHSIKSKREGHTNITNGETGSGTTATNDVKIGCKFVANDTVSSSTTTPVVAAKKMESEREKSMKLAKGGSSTTTTVNAKSTVSQKQNKKISRTRRPTLGEILDPRFSEIFMETANTECKSSNKQKKRKKRKLTENKLASGDILNTNGNIKYTDIANNELGGTLSIEKVPMQSHVHGCQQMDTNVARPLSGSTTLRKKLLIFDLNGLVADIVSPRPKDRKPDACFGRRAIFKRPFLDEFLCFCFERFDVGIWSSRTKKVLVPVVKVLLQDWEEKLLFLWDASHCTNSGTRTLEDRYKPLVLKKLSKIWKEYKDYDESNTLLLDDSPYKALVNPKHTGIFPPSYSYKDINDNTLGPEGDLRVYLEGIVAAEDVRTYVEQHPFGQGPIDETNPNWSFYRRVVKGQQQT